MEVNGLPLLADAKTILTELRTQLELNNIPLLRDIKPTTNNIQFTCPAHADGQERKPSCGMNEVDIIRNGRTIPAGTVHCFTCGYTASLTEFISYIFGYGIDGGAFGYKWLAKNFITVEVENRKPLGLNFSRGTNQEEEKEEFISEQELEKYMYYHDYMYERKLTDPVINYFNVGYDKETDCLTFPVANKEGKIIMVQRRAVKGKFFKNPNDTRKSETLYGLDKVYKILNNPSSTQFYKGGIKELIVCESIIDALTCWTHKRPAVALMGTGAEQQYQLLKELPIRKIILALDNDSAGAKGTAKLVKHLKGLKMLYYFSYPNGCKDLNDLSWEQFENMKELMY